MSKKLSLYSVIKKDNRNTLTQLIEQDPNTVNAHLKAGHDYCVLAGTIAYDARKCFDLLIHQKNLNYNNTTGYGDFDKYALTLAVQTALNSDNDYYFSKLLEYPKLDISLCIRFFSMRKCKGPKADALFQRLINHPNTKNCSVDNYDFEYMIGTNKINYVKLILDNLRLEDESSGTKKTYGKINVLVLAILARKFDITKMLIEEYKVDVNEMDTRKIYPIVAACKTTNQKIIKYLISKGVNLNVTYGEYRDGNNKEQMSLLILLINLRNTKKAQIVKCAKLIINAGADVNYKSDYDMTAIKYAITFKFPTLIEILIAKGADISDENLFLMLNKHIRYSQDYRLTEDELIDTCNILMKNGKNILCHNENTNLLMSAMEKVSSREKCYGKLISLILTQLKASSVEVQKKYLFDTLFSRYKYKNYKNQIYYGSISKDSYITIQMNAMDIIKNNWPQYFNSVWKCLDKSLQ